VLIGGFAVVLHGFERMTRDIDIVINLKPGNLEKLKTALYSVFKDNSINEIQEGDFQQYPVIRYGTPDDFVIDIMYNIGAGHTYSSMKYEMRTVNNVTIRLATPETLFELKNDTIREKDKIDAMFLAELIRSKQNAPKEQTHGH
jgi:hypothetical protein